MQHWYSVAHPEASPYRLYALSNVGSLGALLTYPFLVEPTLSSPAQGATWSIAFAVFTAFQPSDVWFLAQAALAEARSILAPYAVHVTATQPPSYTTAWFG